MLSKLFGTSSAPQPRSPQPTRMVAQQVVGNRREWLRNHPEDATTEEQLQFARGEIKELLKLQTSKNGSEGALRTLMARSGLPIAQLLRAADEEAAHAARRKTGSFSASSSCGGHGKVVHPAGETFDPVRNDDVPHAPHADMSQLFRVLHCQVGGDEIFEIRRLRECRAPRDLTDSVETLATLVRDYGPDELVVTLEGPELLPCNVSYLGACRYVARCGTIRRAGAYHLLAMHMRSQYDALDEKRPEWPPMQWDQIAGDAVLLDLKPAERDGGHLKPAERDGGRARPYCDEKCGRMSAVGRWSDSREAPPPVRLLGPLPRMGVSSMRGLYVKAGQYYWRPDRCALRTWSLPLLTGCLRSANVTSLRLVGDSHSATLFMQLLTLLHWGYPKQSNNSFFEKTVTDEVDGVRAYKDYDNKKYHQSPQATGGGDGSVVLVNFGQHEAAARMPLDAFEAKVRGWATGAVRWRRAGAHRHVFWLTGPIGVPRTDGYVRGKADGRTIHRSNLFVEVAARIARNASIPVIDSTSPIRAFPLLTSDPAHYTDANFRVYYPWVVLGQLGPQICPAHLAHADRAAHAVLGESCRPHAS